MKNQEIVKQDQKTITNYKVKVSNLAFHSTSKLANALALNKAFNLRPSESIRFIEANMIKPAISTIFTIDKEVDEVIHILNNYHITCDITKL